MTQEPTTTAVIKVAPDKDDSVRALSEQVTTLLRYAESRVILSAEDVKSATEDLSFIAKLKKVLEEKRKEFIDPINLFLKSINDTFKLIVWPLEAADKLTRDKILAYRREQERKALEIEEINRLRMEAAQREAKLNEGEITESIVVIDVPPVSPLTVRTDVGTLGTMRVWKFEVTDFSQLPDRFKLENATLIGKVVRAGEREIPGVRIWYEDTLKVSTR